MHRNDLRVTEPVIVSWARGIGARCLGLSRGFWALVALGWTGLIWFLSSHEGDTGSGLFVMQWAGNLVHAPLFGLLALWIILAGPRIGPAGSAGWARLLGRDRWLVFALVMAWGISDELHQSFVPGRDASVLDLVTDAVGAWAVILATRAASPIGTGRAESLGRILLLGLGACLLAALAASI